MKNINLIIIISSLLLSSCTNILDVELPVEAPKLVINGIMIADSAWKVQILSSKALQAKSDSEQYSNIYSFVENAEAKIYNGTTLITQLQYNNNGEYASKENPPKAGEAYTIKVHAKGYPDAEATDTIPVAISNIGDSLLGPFNDEFYNYYILNFQFSLPKNNNIYLGAACKMEATYQYDSITWISVDYPIIDYNTLGGIFTRGSAFRIFKSKDLVNNSLSMNITPKDDFFSSELIKGEQFYYLVNYSYTFYQYFISLSEYQLDDILIEEKAPVYSNVKGGYGIFAAKNMGKEVLTFTSYK